MSRVIQLPPSGGDRKHYVRELRWAQQAHADICQRVKDAIKIAEAHRIAAWALSCEEWNIRQFIGGDAAPSPPIADAISAGFELIEVQCKRCRRTQVVDLALIIWPRENQVHTLAKALRCQDCRRAGKRPEANLIALRHRAPDDDAPAAQRARV